MNDDDWWERERKNERIYRPKKPWDFEEDWWSIKYTEYGLRVVGVLESIRFLSLSLSLSLMMVMMMMMVIMKFDSASAQLKFIDSKSAPRDDNQLITPNEPTALFKSNQIVSVNKSSTTVGPRSSIN